MHREYPCAGCSQQRACMFQKLACFDLASHKGEAAGVPQHLQTYDRVPARIIYNLLFDRQAKRDKPDNNDYFDPYAEDKKYLLRTTSK